MVKALHTCGGHPRCRKQRIPKVGCTETRITAVFELLQKPIDSSSHAVAFKPPTSWGVDPRLNPCSCASSTSPSRRCDPPLYALKSYGAHIFGRNSAITSQHCVRLLEVHLPGARPDAWHFTPFKPCINQACEDVPSLLGHGRHFFTAPAAQTTRKHSRIERVFCCVTEPSPFLPRGGGQRHGNLPPSFWQGWVPHRRLDLCGPGKRTCGHRFGGFDTCLKRDFFATGLSKWTGLLKIWAQIHDWTWWEGGEFFGPTSVLNYMMMVRWWFLPNMAPTTWWDSCDLCQHLALTSLIMVRSRAIYGLNFLIWIWPIAQSDGCLLNRIITLFSIWTLAGDVFGPLTNVTWGYRGVIILNEPIMWHHEFSTC